MGVPIFLLRQRFVDAVVKVLVVGKDDMPADIVKLARRSVLHLYEAMKFSGRVADVRSPQALHRSRLGHPVSHSSR